MQIAPDAGGFGLQSRGKQRSKRSTDNGYGISLATRRQQISILIEIMFKSFKVYDMNFDYI